MIGPPRVPPNSFQRSFGRGAPLKLFDQVVGVQHVVAEEFEHVAVKVIRARLDLRADDRAHEVAELGRSVLRDLVELLNGVHARRIAHQVVRHLVVVHAVQNEVVGLLAVAVDVRPSAAGRRLAVGEAGRIRMYAARRQQASSCT